MRKRDVGFKIGPFLVIQHALWWRFAERRAQVIGDAMKIFCAWGNGDKFIG